MKKIQFIFSLVFMVVATISCTKKDGIDQDLSFLKTASSGNTAKIFDISTDNSGNVKITPTGEGVTSFLVSYGHGTGANASATVLPGNSTTHSYPEGTYTVSITSTDIAGHQTTVTYPLTVTYVAPSNLNITTGGDMTVSATATYAKSFLVYYGDVANEVGTPMAIGQTLPGHIYPATGGPFTLKVVALSGGAATTTKTKLLFGLPIDFETSPPDLLFGTFGNVNFTTGVTNPSKTGLNTSNTVGKYEKTVGAATWSGTYSPLNIPINFSYGKKIKVLLYNPDPALIGQQLNVELEWYVGDPGPANPWGAVVRAPITTSGAWEELVFDFSTISAIPTSPLPRFTQLVLRFDDANSGTGQIIYLDNFRLTN
ncbi:MAG: hypothetical protein KGL19_00010 [Bacteroidota bacterium]|nr:hypothetical protein [Bacteroidota bacterium]